MPNVRVSGTSYTNNMRSIVAIPDHYVALPAQIAASAAKTIDGKKYILAGTPVTNATTLEGRKTGLTVATGTDQFDGLIFTDQEVFEGETNITVTVLVHGFVKYGAIQKVGSSVPTSKNPMILVMK